MWTLKIKVREKGNLFGKRTKKHKVQIYFYSHNYYEKKGRLHFLSSGIIVGDEESRKNFVDDLNKENKMEYLEVNGDFFISIYSERKTSSRTIAVKIAYNPKLVFIKPVIIDSEGWEEWEVACNERKSLEEFIKQAETLNGVEYELFYFKEQKINNLMIYSIMPKLTDKQKHVLLLAVNEGYYGYPRKIKLVQLAKLMKISLSTYQFHLAKAEAKLMPFLVKRL